MAADEACRQSLNDLFAEGLAIATSRTRDVYLQLEERGLTAEEERIVAERVALQRRLLAVYETRERARKVDAIGQVLPGLSEIQLQALIDQFASEDDAVAAYAADPGILMALKQPCGGVDADLPADASLPEIPKCVSKGRRSLRHTRRGACRLEGVEYHPSTSSCGGSDLGRGATCSREGSALGGKTSDECYPNEAQSSDLSAAEAAQEASCVHGPQPTSVPGSLSEVATAGLAVPHLLTASVESTCDRDEAFSPAGRPRRKASAGISRLIQSLTRESAGCVRRKRRAAKPEPAPRKQVHDPFAARTPHVASGTASARPAKKPRLGRVKRCSFKPVDIITMGRLRTEPGWHNRGCIFPDGFTSCTMFRSSTEIGQSCRHVCSIVGRGGRFWPMPTFCITAEDVAEPVVAQSATGAWTGILRRISSAITARRRAGENLPPPPGTAIPGPEFFGLTNPAIVAGIERLDRDRQCSAYWQGKKDRIAYMHAHGSEPVRRDAEHPRMAGGGRRRPLDSDGSSSEEEADEAAIVYDDDSDTASEPEERINRWSALDRAQRRQARGGGAPIEPLGDPDGECAALAGLVDPITLQGMQRPAASPAGHVMGMATWAAVLQATGRCPFTKQPLRKDQLTLVTPRNIHRFRSRLLIGRE